MSSVIVIGGGAAGMMAAYSAAIAGHDVVLLEKNEKLGKKIYITGKGRCNFTNASDMETILQNIVSHPKFMYSALYTFSNDSVMDFFESNGMPYKVERGNRVFPVSDHSSDVIRTMEKALKNNGVDIRLHTRVKKLLIKDGKAVGVELSDHRKIKSDNVIVATGGMSYQTTGSTGDGYGFARETGHQISQLRPALVPLETMESYIPRMQGLSLKNVRLSVYLDGKKKYDEFGEMMFTHFGVTGPLILFASSVLSRFLPGKLKAYIDLKPALSKQQLDERLLRIFKEHPKIHIKNVYQQLLPSKMIPVMLELVAIDGQKSVCEFTKREREKIIQLLKEFPFTVVDTRSFKEAIITQGGVDVRQIDPSTMESKNVKNLYFAGEVLDVDGYTGGYNLQIAWSTGYLAGISLKEENNEF